MDYSKHNAVSNLNGGSNIMTRQELTRRAVMVVLTSPELRNSTKSMILRAYGNCGMFELVHDELDPHLGIDVNSGDSDED